MRGFITKWQKANPKYRLIANNCQDFTEALLRELGNKCPSRVRRHDEGSQPGPEPAFQESLKAQCSINSATLSSICASNWKLSVLLGPLMAFAMFYMN